MKNKQSGISLLEVLLSLVIIATITTMSVRYFTVTNRSMRVSTSIKEIKHLTNLSYEWLQAQRQADFSGNPNGTAISMQVLADTKLIENLEHEKYNPWGGDITIEPGSNPSYVKITLTQIPQKDCRSIVRQLKNSNHLTNTPCGSAYGNTFSGEF